MRALGFSYTSGLYDGDGLDYAMVQPEVPEAYYGDISKPSYNREMVFAYDARAMQLPGILGEAAAIMNNPN